MPIPTLTIIGETINDSVPSTKKLFDAGDIAGLLELARFQDEKGERLHRCQRGSRPPEFMAEMVRKIQEVTAKPLSIDTPIRRSPAPGWRPTTPGRRAAADLELDQSAADGNVRSLSIPSFPADPAGVRAGRRRRIEALPNGRGDACQAQWLVRTFKQRCPGTTNDDCIIDPGIAPIGSDTESNLHRLIGASGIIHGGSRPWPAFMPRWA